MAGTSEKGRDVAVKNLSKNLRQMKFMQRTVLKEQAADNEELYKEDDEHWVIDNKVYNDDSCIEIQPSFTLCSQLNYGRFSFKGFNTEVEKCMRVQAGEELEDHIEEQKKEDLEFAKQYCSVVDTVAKKFNKRYHISSEMSQKNNNGLLKKRRRYKEYDRPKEAM